MGNKKYECIPKLMESVCFMCRQTTFTLRFKNVLPENHPSRRQTTVAHTAPSSTDELIKASVQDFIDILVNIIKLSQC